MVSGTALGFSLNPVKAVKKVGSAVKKGAVATGKFAKRNVGTVAKVAVNPALYVAAKSTKLVGSVALAPVKARIRTLTARRARKIAWDRRKSKAPNQTEMTEARNWTKANLRSKGPHGALLASLAGAPPLGAVNLGVAPALTAAAVPVLIAIVNNLMQKSAASGEAPAALPDEPAPSPQAVIEPSPEAAQAVEETVAADEYPAEEAVADDQVAEEAMTNGYYLGAPDTSNTALYVGLAVALGLAGGGLYCATR